MTAFARIRLDLDEAILLEELLVQARNRRIREKIAARDDGDQAEADARRWELNTIKRLQEETRRAMEDLNGHEEMGH